MKILVTGAAGFIGGHLTDRLLEDGHRVWALDNLSFGRQSHVADAAALWVVDLGQVEEALLVERALAFDPDYAVHLAAIHFIPYCMARPEDTFASNVRGTDVLMRSLAKCPNLRKVVSASTMDVYCPSDRTHRETDVPSPRNVYGLSKLLSEQIVSYHATTSEQLSAVCLRFANVYGPRETNPHLIPDTLQRLASKVEPEIRMGYLGGERDFIHVRDVVAGICGCLFTETGKYEVFNLGTGVPTPVRRVIEILRCAFRDDRPIVEDSAKLRSFDRKSLTPEIGKIREAIGWEPRVQIEDGLRELAQTPLSPQAAAVVSPVGVGV
jgi:UDP-glucose 4-epimerase